MEETKRPFGLADLRELWRERDNRYSVRRISGMFQQLSAGELNSVKAYREKEARTLLRGDEIDRALADVWDYTAPRAGAPR